MMGHTAKRVATFTCKYQGFVHADTNEAGVVPGTEFVQKAIGMLQKKQLKKTQKIHPLFGRGFDTDLLMSVSSYAVRVDTMESATVMNAQLHKIAFLASIKRAMGIIVKRPGVGKFKCHMFQFANEDEAYTASSTIIRVTNDAFRMVRRCLCMHACRGLCSITSVVTRKNKCCLYEEQKAKTPLDLAFQSPLSPYTWCLKHSVVGCVTPAYALIWIRMMLCT
eukprot:m.91493 g.91493  ORF g.91493 m.91493 type:complete len:222 (+) comp12948_c0_seq7:184-849(+)